MFNIFKHNKQDEFENEIKAILANDSDRKLIAFHKISDKDRVAVILLQCLPLIKVELHHSNKRYSVSIITTTVSDGVLNIGDIHMQYNCAGLGTIAMACLLKFAKEQKYSKVTGWISSVDSDHFDRLEHFYKKFGFDVVFNKGSSEGNIELNLKEQ